MPLRPLRPVQLPQIQTPTESLVRGLGVRNLMLRNRQMEEDAAAAPAVRQMAQRRASVEDAQTLVSLQERMAKLSDDELKRDVEEQKAFAELIATSRDESAWRMNLDVASQRWPSGAKHFEQLASQPYSPELVENVRRGVIGSVAIATEEQKKRDAEAEAQGRSIELAKTIAAEGRAREKHEAEMAGGAEFDAAFKDWAAEGGFLDNRPNRARFRKDIWPELQQKAGKLLTPEAEQQQIRIRGAGGSGKERLVQIMGEAGTPIWVRESDAVGKPAAQAARAVTGAERQYLAYYNRAKEAVETLTNPGPNGAPSLEERIARSNILSQAQLQYAPNIAQSSEQQSYRQAQRAFTEARLRKESGAAIPVAEYENDARTYFAQPGDSKETIEQKRRARETVLEGLKFSSGKAYEEYYGGTGGPKVGTVEDGYRFKGGDPGNPASWEKVSE